MVREGWNFHGDVAIQLEGIGRSYYGWTGRPMTKIFDADAIESGSFVECMTLLLREKTSYNWETEGIDEFLDKCAPYFRKSGNSIDREVAQELFDEFTTLFESM